MKIALDLLPLAVFFGAWWVGGLFVATAALIGACALQILILKICKRKIEPAVWVSAALVAVFGGLTLVLRDKSFIQFKPTALYLLFAAAIVFADLALKKNIARALFRQLLLLSDTGWRKLSFAWAGFFALLAAANWLVVANFSEKMWVSIKTFGFPAATLAFLLLHALLPLKQAEQK